jgi:hypothetical protein
MEQNPANAKSLVTLYGTPGLKSWLSGVGSGPIRGVHKMGAHLWVVSGNELYKIDSTKTKTLISGTIEKTGNVYMEDNGFHVAIGVVGGKLYAADASGIIELPFGNMNGIAYQDGYLIYAQAGTEKIYISGIDDATTISALDYTTADASPDTLRGIISDHRELAAFGEDTTEFFYNSGNANFPFERAGGGFMEHGCSAPGSIAKAENAIFWLGDDLAPYMATGYQAQTIAEPWVERLIEDVSDPTSAWGYTYRQAGHVFWVLTFSDLTLVFDMKTSMWHKRKSDGTDRWRANGHAYYRRKHIVGDFETGDLYELDLDTYTDNSDTIRREVMTSIAHSQGAGVICDEFFLDMETGVGLVSGQGSDPQVMLDWSEDDGVTWSNELWRSAGPMGERKHRAMWNRLGRFRKRTFRVAISDPIKVAILAAYVRIQPLNS